MIICPIYELQRQISKYPNQLSAICCTRKLRLEGQLRNLLHLDFDDLTKSNTAPWTSKLKDQLADGTYKLPSITDVKTALDFAKNHGTRKLAVACDAGISRSTAIAWSILLAESQNPTEATDKLFKLQPLAMPNRDIIRYALELIPGNATYIEVNTMLTKTEAKFA